MDTEIKVGDIYETLPDSYGNWGSVVEVTDVTNEYVHYKILDYTVYNSNGVLDSMWDEYEDEGSADSDYITAFLYYFKKVEECKDEYKQGYER